MSTSTATSTIAGIGDPRAFLLAGPDSSRGPESFEEHAARLGPLGRIDPAVARRELLESGLSGRGGAGFSTAIKISAAEQPGRQCRLIINASESEPASKKDSTLATLRPHLVLDGAIVLASMLGIETVTVVGHHGATLLSSLASAWQDRRGELGVLDLVATSGGYVAGESSAVASAAIGGEAIPQSRTTPLAVSGLDGVPTIVLNVETIAHLALIYRMGGERWRGIGGDGDCGPRLATIVDGDTGRSCVVEVHGPTSVGALLSSVNLCTTRALLLGGYSGTWIDPEATDLAELLWSTKGLGQVGASLGCGLVIALCSSCGWCTSVELVRYLASQSAGQCGPCLYGLDAMASAAARLARSLRPRAIAATMDDIAASTNGRGGCSHPDATIEMVQSAVATFDPTGRGRAAHRHCARANLDLGGPR